MTLADQRSRFEIMTEQAQIPQDILNHYFSRAYIEKVEVQRGQRHWKE